MGWNRFHQNNLDGLQGGSPARDNLLPGRISAVYPGNCRVLTEKGEVYAVLPGVLRSPDRSAGIAPAVGDWALVDAKAPTSSSIIKHVLPRKSRISRNSAGLETREQVLAANVDIAFIVGSLNSELNYNRMERFLVSVYDGDITPVLLLNKSDLCPDAGSKVAELRARMPAITVHATSAATGEGLGALDGYLDPGTTAVFLGSSGVGKSTIINRLLGSDTIRTEAISNYKDRGRHTTTAREMYLLDRGGIVIDTPGLRELQVWGGEKGVAQTFADIEELAGQCRFSDCRHQGEPGCAVRAALEEGSISPERFHSYRKILRESMFHLRSQDQRLRMEEARRWKTITKTMRHYEKSRRRAGD